jgi:hypothetical protein
MFLFLKFCALKEMACMKFNKSFTNFNDSSIKPMQENQNFKIFLRILYKYNFLSKPQNNYMMQVLFIYITQKLRLREMKCNFMANKQLSCGLNDFYQLAELLLQFFPDSLIIPNIQ